MIHYHGLPITPKERLAELAGFHFCLRYGAHHQGEQALAIASSLMVDNGAYTVWTKEREPDWPGFYAWVERFLTPTNWAVIPDVIEGDEADNDALLAEWEATGLPRGAPVWHMHESLERLRRLASDYERICIGSSGAYAKIGTDAWHRRLTGAFDALCGTGPVPVWVHGLRMMSMSGTDYPFSSVDSADVGRNSNRGRGVRKDVVKKAAEWDAKQNPVRWVAHEQLSVL